MRLKKRVISLSLVVFLLLSSIASSSPIAPGNIGNGAVIASCLLIISYVSFTDKRIVFPKIGLVLLSTIYVSLFISFIFNSSSYGVDALQNYFYAFGFIVVSFSTILLVPQIISFNSLVKVVNRLIILLFVIGIPEVFMESTILPYGREPYAPINAVYHIEYRAITSIFEDSNAMGKLALFGIIMSAIEYRQTKTRSSILIFIFMLFGLFLSDSRGAYLGVISGFAVLFIHIYYGKAFSRGVTLLGLSTSFLFIFMIAGVLPYPDVFPQIRLSNRDQAWTAALQVIIQSPLFGEPVNPILSDKLLSYGYATPQNSYFRMFLVTGLLGGLAFLGLIVHLMWVSTSTTMCEYYVLIPVCIGVIMLFETYSILGTNINSVLASMLFGYLLQFPNRIKTSDHGRSADNV